MPIDLAHLSDEALVALVARNDEVALAELYDRWGRVSYGLALRILHDPVTVKVKSATLTIDTGHELSTQGLGMVYEDGLATGNVDSSPHTTDTPATSENGEANSCRKNIRSSDRR